MSQNPHDYMHKLIMMRNIKRMNTCGKDVLCDLEYNFKTMIIFPYFDSELLGPCDLDLSLH